jgi:hypothetical protein
VIAVNERNKIPDLTESRHTINRYIDIDIYYLIISNNKIGRKTKKQGKEDRKIWQVGGRSD